MSESTTSGAGTVLGPGSVEGVHKMVSFLLKNIYVVEMNLKYMCCVEICFRLQVKFTTARVKVKR